MFRFCLALVLLMFGLTCKDYSLAATVKLICRNSNALPGGPLEIDVQNRVVYRYIQREQWPITGVTDEHITMTAVYGVGGEIAVLDLASGELHSVAIGIYLNKLQSFVIGTQTCKQSILSK